MRKRTVNHLADTIFWYVIYMLPIILTLIQSIGLFGNFTFADWQGVTDSSNFYNMLLNNLYSLGIRSGGLVSSTLYDIFGQGGILPLVFQPVLFRFAEWFVVCVLVHLCIDFILFIPRIAHKWMKKCNQED